MTGAHREFEEFYISLQISHDLVRRHEAIRIVALIFRQLSFTPRGLRGEFKLICGPPCLTVTYFNRGLLTAYWCQRKPLIAAMLKLTNAAQFPRTAELGSPLFAQPAALNGYLRARIEAQKEGHEQSFR